MSGRSSARRRYTLEAKLMAFFTVLIVAGSMSLSLEANKVCNLEWTSEQILVTAVQRLRQP